MHAKENEADMQLFYMQIQKIIFQPTVKPLL
jgi:hypothetical protein